MADHGREGRRRGPCSRWEGRQLKLRQARPQVHLSRLKEQVVAGDPVPPEDEVVPHVHVHWRDRHRLVECVSQAKVDQHRHSQPLLPLGSSRRYRERTRLARARKVQSRRQARADEAVCRSRIQDGGHMADPLRRREAPGQAWLQGRVGPHPREELGRTRQRGQLRLHGRGEGVDRVVDLVRILRRPEVSKRRPRIPSAPDRRKAPRAGWLSPRGVPVRPDEWHRRRQPWGQEGSRREPLRRRRAGRRR